MPVRSLETKGWLHAPRMPLGEAYQGRCHANDDMAIEPPESDQRELCNCGYARGRCSRFPADSADAGDAVRFSVAEDAGGVVRVIWVVEKGHSPGAFGSLEYSIDAAELSGAGERLLIAQARAFLESYLRRTGIPTAEGLYSGY